mmetsp:Transcript_18222/g.37899  ORF Transcript_18222/g.37899 Transcript_18222/m.37899 type:complete len:148 (+) Transcript_18222:45-488(+)
MAARLVQNHSTILPGLPSLLKSLLCSPTPISTLAPGRMYKTGGNRGAPRGVVLKISPGATDGATRKFKLLAREESRVQELFMSTSSKFTRLELADELNKLLSKDVKKKRVKILVTNQSTNNADDADKLSKPRKPPPYKTPFLRPPWS